MTGWSETTHIVLRITWCRFSPCKGPQILIPCVTVRASDLFWKLWIREIPLSHVGFWIVARACPARTQSTEPTEFFRHVTRENVLQFFLHRYVLICMM